MHCKSSSHHVYGFARWGFWPVGASGPLGHLVRKDIWPVGASGLLGHLARLSVWSVGTSGPLERLVRWNIWPVGASGPLGHLPRWGFWSARTYLAVGASGLLGHLARWGVWSETSDTLGHLIRWDIRLMKRLALVEHLAVKGCLVRHRNTSGPKGHLRQRERWYIWRREAHLVHLALEGASGTSCTSIIGRIQVKVEIC